MRTLVTGSAGHLGEALVRTLRAWGRDVVGVDLLASPFTERVGSICDADFVRRCMRGVEVVLHTATLHKPHVATHAKQAFVDTNISGTLNVLEAALAEGVSAMVFTSTTSVFGAALKPEPGQPTAWIDEEVLPVPKNIYGVTKAAAEDLCHLFYRTKGLPCIVLRTSRFFPEPDDDPERRRRFEDANLKANELLHRRLDVADAVDAHLLAAERARAIGFGRYILSATTPFDRRHLARLREDAAGVVRDLFPGCEAIYRRRGWRLPPGIDRVYDNRRAREELGWRPRYDFRHALDCLRRDEDFFSPLARQIGAKGYHQERFKDGLYPIETDE